LILSRSKAWGLLACCGAASLALVALHPDSYQQDGGHHFLFARYAWAHPALFVGVWNRPLFTFLYAFPALLGYPAAKLFTIVIALVTAWQTYRLAQDLKLERAWFAIALIFLEPSYFLLSSETMTEPLFALLFVAGVRLHVAGRVAAGMFVASLMPLARPEGFFLAPLWAAWVLTDARDARAWWQRLPGLARLGAGICGWWLAALVITGDPLFIRHNWPAGWTAADRTYGSGPIWIYIARLPEMAGPFLAFVFLIGLVVSLRTRRLMLLTTAFLTLFVIHSVIRVAGAFGSAGYARYFLSVSPAIAIITLAGWNDVAARMAAAASGVRRSIATAVIALSAVVCVLYVDMAGFYGRDARAVNDMRAWFREHPQPVTRLIWSQAYMCIALDRDPLENITFTGNRKADLDALRNAGPGTLVFWDQDTGPAWHGLTASDIEAAGFVRLHSQTYVLDGWLRESRWLFAWPPRRQEMHLLYK